MADSTLNSLTAKTAGQAARGIYVGVSGDIVAILCPGTAAVTFKSVPVGILPIEASRVKATGTTATDLLALY